MKKMKLLKQEKFFLQTLNLSGQDNNLYYFDIKEVKVIMIKMVKV